MNTFWATVKKELDESGSNYAALARHTNVPLSTIATQYKSGKIPSADKAQDIADYLKVELKYLLAGSGKEMSKERSRWMAWIESCTDEELEKSREVLKFADEFLEKMSKRYYQPSADQEGLVAEDSPVRYNK